MTKHTTWDSQYGGWLVQVESYYGEIACAFFFRAIDAENWNPFQAA